MDLLLALLLVTAAASATADSRSEKQWLKKELRWMKKMERITDVDLDAIDQKIEITIDWEKIKKIKALMKERATKFEKVKSFLEVRIYGSTSAPIYGRPPPTPYVETELDVAVRDAQTASLRWEAARAEAGRTRADVADSRLPRLQQTLAERSAELDGVGASRASSSVCQDVAAIGREALTFFTSHYVEDYALVLAQLAEVASAGSLVVAGLSSGPRELCLVRRQTRVLAGLTLELAAVRGALDTRHDLPASQAVLASVFALLRCACGSTAPPTSAPLPAPDPTTPAPDVTVPPTPGTVLDPAQALQDARRAATAVVADFQQVQLPAFQALQGSLQTATLPALARFFSAVSGETSSYYQVLNNVQDACADTSGLVTQLLAAVVLALQTDLEGLLADWSAAADSDGVAALEAAVAGSDVCDLLSKAALAAHMVARLGRLRQRLSAASAFATDSFLGGSQRPVALVVDLQRCVCSHVVASTSEAPTTVPWSTLVPPAASVQPLSYCDDTDLLSGLHVCWKPAMAPLVSYLKSDSEILP